MKRVRLTSEAINSYGTWVRTAGIDLTQYKRNPILLYMHRRGEVIGTVVNIQVEGDAITAELSFDEVSDLSKQCKQQWEIGSLRMVSVGLDIIEVSEDKKYLKEGQMYPTITKSKLFEVSLVDVGANDEAIVLHKEGKAITLGAGSDNPLTPIKQTPKQKSMNQEALALSLGLAKDATEEQINARIAELNKTSEENAQLKAQAEASKTAQIEAMVDTAIEQKLFSADKKEHFIALGKQVGADALKATFSAMSPQVKLSGVIGHHGGAPTQPSTVTYQKLSDVPADKILELKTSNKAEYARLFKAEYGIELADAE